MTQGTIRRGWQACAALLLCASVSLSVQAQQCDDFDDCTTTDVCSEDGTCHGTPAIGASCPLPTDALINGRCVESDSGVICQGEPAPLGSPCNRGCGTWQELFPGSTSKICVGPQEMFGQPCPDSPADPCVSTTCGRNGPEIVCRFTLVECPDDGDPCTSDTCSSETGQCASHSMCNAECETCSPETGGCVPTNIGGPCNDNNPCTDATECRAVDIPGYRIVGQCEPVTRPTQTPTSTTPTATPTEVTTPTPIRNRCIGDCDDDGSVKVNELVIGVNIALGRASFLACSRFDESANQHVEVNEIVRGVNSLLLGCGGEQPAPL